MDDSNMQPLSTPLHTVYPREIYAVDGHRVINDAASGWKCECRVFAPSLHCDHVRQAVRFRAVRETRVR
jgi:hypothetical protein